MADRWIRADEHTTVCPDCKHEFNTGCLYSVGDLYAGYPNFCPHCGAKIVEGRIMFEVYCDGEPTGRLFFSEENARLWINTHCDGEACYSVRPFMP